MYNKIIQSATPAVQRGAIKIEKYNILNLKLVRKSEKNDVYIGPRNFLLFFEILGVLDDVGRRRRRQSVVLCVCT